jgi:pre-60S factor REI1
MAATAPGGEAMQCLACGVALASVGQRLEHYKTEWHRYNIKRRCANLGPVGEAVFNAKVAALRSEVEPSEGEFGCEVCRKSFASQDALQRHLQTRTHLKRAEHARGRQSGEASSRASGSASASGSALQSPLLGASASAAPGGPPLVEVASAAALGAGVGARAAVGAADGGAAVADDAEDEEDEEDEKEDGDEDEEEESGEGIPLGHCLFCASEFESVEASLDHMLKKHGFFVPFAELLTDVEGLLLYLGEKVAVGRMCLWCNGRGRGRFPSMRAAQQHMEDKGHCKIRFEEDEDDDEFTDFYDFESVGRPAGVEEEEEDEEDEEEDREPEQKERALVPAAASATRRVTGMNVAGELVLSDGSALGHRSFALYYRQKLRPRGAERARPNSALVASLVGSYRSLGLPGYSHSHPARDGAKHPIHAQRASKQALKVGMAGNSQPHFRRQMLV